MILAWAAGETRYLDFWQICLYIVFLKHLSVLMEAPQRYNFHTLLKVHGICIFNHGLSVLLHLCCIGQFCQLLVLFDGLQVSAASADCFGWLYFLLFLSFITSKGLSKGAITVDLTKQLSQDSGSCSFYHGLCNGYLCSLCQVKSIVALIPFHLRWHQMPWG